MWQLRSMNDLNGFLRRPKTNSEQLLCPEAVIDTVPNPENP
jgi:hypothetical protein